MKKTKKTLLPFVLPIIGYTLIGFLSSCGCDCSNGPQYGWYQDGYSMGKSAKDSGGSKYDWTTAYQIEKVDNGLTDYNDGLPDMAKRKDCFEAGYDDGYNGAKNKYDDSKPSVSPTKPLNNNKTVATPTINSQPASSPVKDNSNNNNDNAGLKNIVLGSWNGDFGKKKITIKIEQVVIGDSVLVTGNDALSDGSGRPLRGEMHEISNDSVYISLNEPGDQQWDGMFSIAFSKTTNKAKGIWKSFNGKLTREFQLEK